MDTATKLRSRRTLQRIAEARRAWLLGLFEFPWSIGATRDEVRALCRRTGYPHWGGMLNGNGLVEPVPGGDNVAFRRAASGGSGPGEPSGATALGGSGRP